MTGYTRSLIVNTEETVVEGGDDNEPLLYVLRNKAGQRGPKFGCGVSQCGACTVLVDDAIVRSCVRPVRTVPDGSRIRTLDGLVDDSDDETAGDVHPVQAAMIERDAGQCAYCVNGVVMGAIGWLEARAAGGDRSNPSEAEIRAFLSGHLDGYTLNYICRCGAHPRYVEAIQDAAEEVLG